MHTIGVPNYIQKIMGLYIKLGLWQSGDRMTCKETNMKIFYTMYYLLVPTSFLTGAFVTEFWEESVFLVNATVITIVGLVRLWYLIWNKNEILELVERLGIHSIEDNEAYTLINRKLEIFIKFVTAFMTTTCFMACLVLGVPFIGDERQLFFKMWFPFDWKNNDIFYLIALIFLTTEGILSLISVTFAVLVWYLLLNCSMQFDNLASKLRAMGEIRAIEEAPDERKVSVEEKQLLFHRDLNDGIEFHKEITEYH